MTPAPDDGSGSAFEQEIVTLIEQGKRIEAIKLYRQRMGVGLKEAKDAVDELAARHGFATKGISCAGLVVFGLLAGGALATMLW